MARTSPEPITVTLEVGDALSVGLTLQQLIELGRIPPGAVAPFDRVATQLIAAARAAAGTVGQ